MRKPVIGIVPGLTPEDHAFTSLPAYRFDYLKQHYYEAIEDNGGIPIAIPVTEKFENIELYCEMVSGLLLVGGEDINPDLYGEELNPVSKPVIPRRDVLEMKLLTACFERRIPILGICRGLQIMNVAFGGTLYQDLSLREGTADHSQIGQLDFSTRHRVKVLPQTKLHNIVQSEVIETNTAHHQGINQLGKGLSAAAFADDGVIEAIEAEGFTIGVQWHPETWPLDPVSRKLFDAFIESSRK